MNINFIGRQMDVGERLKSLAVKKLAKFDRFFTDETETTVKFYKLRDLECAEVTIASGSTLFRAEEKSDTFSTALDRCVDAIERQIRKNKTRLERRLREGAFTPVSTDEPVEEEVEFDIRTKEFVLRPMTPEEAILQMNLLEHEFFMFQNSKNGLVCVVYKRDNGGYGMIEPKEKV